MSDYLPIEIFAEILVRLPVESLVRSTSVCKTWFSLIKSPSFITKHLNHSKTNSENLLLTTYPSSNVKDCFLLSRGGEKFGYEFSELESPFSSSVWCTDRVGSCDGLLCMVDYVGDDSSPCIKLWNPLIRKSVTLPMPSKPQSSIVMRVFGFAAHPTTHEYMVVYIAYKIKDVMLQKFPSMVELYNQGTGSWRSITSAGDPPHIARSDCFQAYVNGSIHWIASSRKAVGGLCNVIMLFNMTSQAFSVMMMPAALVCQSHMSMSIMSHGEWLAVLSCEHEDEDSSCCIWVMKEYGVAESWAKLYNFNLPKILKIIGFRKNGEVLWSTMDNQLLCYNYETRTLTNSGYAESLNLFAAHTFTDSLVLLEGGNGVFQGQFLGDAILRNSKRAKDKDESAIILKIAGPSKAL